MFQGGGGGGSFLLDAFASNPFLRVVKEGPQMGGSFSELRSCMCGSSCDWEGRFSAAVLSSGGPPSDCPALGAVALVRP